MPDLILPVEFYQRPTLQVARELLGARLVRREGERRLVGAIFETEAYIGEEDQACHAKAGLTPRTRVMYGPAGHAYVYFTYGTHWMLNVVTEAEGFPAAVLIRGIVPLEGLDRMAELRPPPLRSKAGTIDNLFRGWTDGPAKLCQALGIDGSFNGHDLKAAQGELWIEAGTPLLDEAVTLGPRVGIDSAPEPWRSLPWRFLGRIEGASYPP